jgi:hypothetical protein
MSLINSDSLESSKSQSETALEIAALLQAHFESADACYAFFKQSMKVEFYTVRNWYKGLRSPSLENFLSLAQHMPELVNWMLHKTGNSGVSDLLKKQKTACDFEDKIPEFDHNRLIFETNNAGDSFIKFQKLNMRQLWFYSMAQQGYKMRPEKFQKYFGISRATSYREINMLVSYNLIFQMERGIINIT